jgi:K+-sensing histidine kinase KdpD
MPGRDRLVLLAGFAAPLALAAILVPWRASFPNTDAALVLILLVVAVAADGYRPAGFAAALSAAVWFDFFLTRPYEQFSILRRADIQTTLLLLIIGVAVTELAAWGRRQHAVASRRAGYLDGISAAAQAVATGSSPSDLIDQVSRQLTVLLSLQSCHFQHGVAGLGQPARLHHDGTVTAGRQAWDVDSAGFPRGSDLELLVENGGLLQGRFLMTPGPGARPGLEQRLLAAAFADQAGTALAAGHPVDQ